MVKHSVPLSRGQTRRTVISVAACILPGPTYNDIGVMTTAADGSFKEVA